MMNFTIDRSDFQPLLRINTLTINMWWVITISRLQNSPYFCVFKYARAVKQKVWNEVKNRERDWGETRVRLASFARVRHITHALPISLLILRKNPTVLQSIPYTISSSTKYQRLLFLRSSQRVIHFSKQILSSINSIKTTTTEMNLNKNYS